MPLDDTGGWALVLALPRGRRIEVTLLSVALVVTCFVRFGFGGRALVGAVFAVVLVLLAAIDLDRRLIPNAIVLPATAAVLVAQVALYPDRTLEWFLASLGAALFFFVPLLIYPAGMGMGDVKLAALLGAALGRTVVLAVTAGLLAVSVVAVVILVREGLGARKKAIPFGPFLAFGGLVALFLGAR